MTDYEETTTELERKWRQLRMKSFEKWLILYLRNVKLRQFLKNFLAREIQTM